MRFGGSGRQFCKHLAEQARMVKLPQNKVDIINKINRTFTRLEQEYQREPTAR